MYVCFTYNSDFWSRSTSKACSQRSQLDLHYSVNFTQLRYSIGLLKPAPHHVQYIQYLGKVPLVSMRHYQQQLPTGSS